MKLPYSIWCTPYSFSLTLLHEEDKLLFNFIWFLSYYLCYRTVLFRLLFNFLWLRTVFFWLLFTFLSQFLLDFFSTALRFILTPSGDLPKAFRFILTPSGLHFSPFQHFIRVFSSFPLLYIFLFSRLLRFFLADSSHFPLNYASLKLLGKFFTFSS